MGNNKARNYGYDLLRIFCCLSIICLHVSGHLDWSSKYNLVVQGIVRPCLMTFITLSGYYVLSNPITDIKSFYLKKIFFLVFPLVLYSVIYQVVPNFIENKDVLLALQKIDITTILKKDIHGHFWFVYSLVGVYLATPFLQKLIFNLSNKQFILMLAIIFYVVRVFPIITHYNIPALMVDGFPFDTTFTFFYLFGFFIKKNEKLLNVKSKLIIVIIGILNIPFMAFMLTKQPFAATLCNLSLCTVVGTVFYFVFFSLLKPPHFLEKVILYLSKRTFSIYLLHMLVFVLMTQHGIMKLTAENRMYMLGAKVIVIFIICAIVCSFIDLLIVNPVIKIYNKFIDCILAFIRNKKQKKLKQSVDN